MKKLLLFTVLIMILASACRHNEEVVPTTPIITAASIEQSLFGKWNRDSIYMYNTAGEVYQIDNCVTGIGYKYVHGVLTGTVVYTNYDYSIYFTDVAADINPGYYNDTLYFWQVASPGVWRVELNYNGSSLPLVLAWYIRSVTTTSLVLSSTATTPYNSEYVYYYHKQ